jgi:hypothetical protein
MKILCQEKLKPENVTVCTADDKTYYVTGCLHIGFKLDIVCTGSGIERIDFEPSFADAKAYEENNPVDSIHIKNYSIDSNINLEKIPLRINGAIVDIDNKTITLL